MTCSPAQTTGSSGNTTLYGDPFSNDFDSQGLAHAIVGRGGDDTIFYDEGYGALTIDENDPAINPANILVFGAGISAGDITIGSNPAGDLMLSLSGSDQITLTGMLSSGARGVQQIAFADGSSWTLAQIQAFISDQWTIAEGSGATSIDESLNPAGITPSIALAAVPGDVSVTYGSDRNILVLTTAAGDSVTIADIQNMAAIAEQTIHFSDGTVWNLADAVAHLDSSAPVPDLLLGTSAAETFNLDSTQQMTYGNGGGDVFNYAVGDGNVTIYESDIGSNPDNVLAFGPGITLDSLYISAFGGDLSLCCRISPTASPSPAR